MTIKKFKQHEAGERAEIGVWFCESCKGFHIKAGDVLLSFTKTEFTDFTNSIFDTYSEDLSIRNFSNNQRGFTLDLTSGNLSN